MPSIHHAILLKEIEEVARELAREKEKITYLDCTLGGAGHALKIAEIAKGKIDIIGLDEDQTAIERAKSILETHTEKVILEKENFRNLDKVLQKNGIEEVDFILFDLGISSDELETSGKGFTFLKDEPLLMTMGDPEKYPFTAKDVINNWKEEDLANVIFGYGEEKYAKRVAKKIVEYRQKTPILTSAELAEIVKGSMPRIFGKVKIHPATRTFQALRIAVNDELNALKEALPKGYLHLRKGGKMIVISFHSLEDRIVKDFYKQKARLEKAIVSKKPIKATLEEIKENPRARSAKMRILQKI